MNSFSNTIFISCFRKVEKYFSKFKPLQWFFEKYVGDFTFLNIIIFSLFFWKIGFLKWLLNLRSYLFSKIIFYI
jgi:hypothetical protein